MNILIVADVFGQHNNGTTIAAERFMRAMEERGHSVRVAAHCEGREDCIQLPRRRIPFFNRYVEVKNGVVLARPDRRVLRAAIREADVVHFLLPFKVSKAGRKIAQELGVPYTAAFHCQPENFTSHLRLMNSHTLNRWIYWFFNRRFYRFCDRIHCPSDFIAGKLEENGYAAKKYVISNGVVPVYCRRPAVRPPELADRFCILFTGRYVLEKRHDLLLQAAARSRYADRIQLIFAGNGPHREALERQAHRLRLKNPPIFRLFTEQELCDAINTCDLYVHPSDVEIEAVSCIEAITCGLVPVISNSENSATKQFALTPENLFAHGDPASLAARIDYWIEHPQEKAALAERYVEYAQQYSIKACMDRMEQMLFDAAGRRAPVEEDCLAEQAVSVEPDGAYDPYAPPSQTPAG